MSKRKITGKVLVIRLGREETQIALLGKKSELLHTLTVETPAGAVEDGMIRNGDAIIGMLKAALKTPELKRARKAIFSLCTSQVITEVVSVPNLAEKRLEKLIHTNMDMYFPVDMKDYRMIWQVIGPREDSEELSVQLWAVPTAMVSRYYTVANACGLSLEAVDYCGHSIATAVGASYARPVKAAKPTKAKKGKYLQGKEEREVTQPPVTVLTNLYITMDSDLLGMTFVQEGQVVMQRFVQCGSNPSQQFFDLSMMLEYFRSLDMGLGSPIQGYLTGALAADSRLAGELQDMLGIRLMPFACGYDPALCLCVGAGHTDMEFGIPTLNKPGKARRELQSQLWQYALLLAGGIAVVLVMLLMLNSRLTWSSRISSLENTRQTLSIRAQQTNEYSQNYNNYVNLYDAYSADWDTVFGNLQTYNDNLVLVLEELEDMMPEDCSVTNLQIAPNALGVSFACETKEQAAYLIMELRELKYATFDRIPFLQGGGYGPATSYGSDEEAPTEGSVALTDEQISSLVTLFAKTVDFNDVMEVALTLSPEQIELVESTYGQEPTITYEKESDDTYTYLEILETKKGDEITLLKRANAVNELLTTNYFAMYNFFNLLGEDMMRDDPYLWDVIQEDMMSPDNADIWSAIATGTVKDAATLRDYTDRVIAMLIRNDDTILATENLLCTDVGMERWYVYYLEVELGLQEGKSFPYLNVEKILSDLIEKSSFHTGDSMVDEKLNSLVPESAWKMLALLKGSNEEEKEKKPLPGDVSEDTMIQYFKNYIAGTANKGQTSLVEDVLERYKNNDLYGYDKLYKVIDNYIKNGKDEKPEDDKGYIYKTYTEKDLLEMFELFLKYKDAGSTQKTTDTVAILTTWLTNNGKTGIDKLDKLVASWVKTLSKEQQQALITALMGDGASGGSGGSGSGEPVDKRTHFQVILIYKPELIEAELERKGLSQEDKVEDKIAGLLNGEVDE